MADPRQLCFDILGKLKIPDPDNIGDFKTVVYQGTSPQFANYRTGLKKPRQVREYVIQTPSNTAPQLNQRSYMSQAVAAWQVADQTEKNRAKEIAKTRHLPLYQAYLSLKIQELITESEDTMWQDAYPIGSIYINNTAADPNSFMGFGTWTNFGSGKVLVGLDSGQTEFDTLNETGGAKTHTLTTSEIPSHTHTQNSHNHTQNSHLHTISRGLVGGGSPVGPTNAAASGTVNSSSVTATNNPETAVNQNTGGGGAHNNLQPYIVVNFWQRTS